MSAVAPIKQRMAAAYRALSREGRDQVQYHTLMEAVFPREHFPRAWRYQQHGGPPGCAMSFGRALRELGGSSTGKGGYRTVYLPYTSWLSACEPKPANVLEASQYRDPLAVYEAPRRLTREDLERAKAVLLDAGKSRQEFMLFLDANAAEVATWPQWKRDAYTLIREPSDG